MRLSVLDSAALLDWARASVEGLISRSDEINRLNVFPVADADTGTNMLFTMRSAVNAAEASERAPRWRKSPRRWPGGGSWCPR